MFESHVPLQLQYFIEATNVKSTLFLFVIGHNHDNSGKIC